MVQYVEHLQQKPLLFSVDCELNHKVLELVLVLPKYPLFHEKLKSEN